MSSIVSIHTESTQVSTGVRRIPVVAFGLSLSAFLAISFVLCILSYFVAADLPISLVESDAWGWYIAVIFAPLYNFFAAGAH